jgi:hypothetical protein
MSDAKGEAEEQREKWGLKVKGTSFFLASPDGSTTKATLCDTAKDAMSFPTLQAATNFAASVARSRLLPIPPELVAIRTDARSFIVELWSATFAGLAWVLGHLSLFLVFRRSKRLRRSYIFVEIFVLASTVLAFSTLFLYTKLDVQSGWWQILLVYGAIRVAETVVYQINVLLFDQYRNVLCHQNDRSTPPYAVRGFRRLVVLALHNYLEVILWFAAFYAWMSPSLYSARINVRTVHGALYFSISTMATLGLGDIVPCHTAVALFTVSAQALIGLFLTVVVFARVLSLIPAPISMDDYEP